MRWVTVALVVLACACHSNGHPSDAKITKNTLTFGDKRVALPASDLAPDDAPAVTQDDIGRRLAYPTKDGAARIVYVVGDALFVGPAVTRPVDFSAAPDLDHALGPLFETAGPRRAQLVAEVAKARGTGGVVSLLVASAYVDDRVWDEAARSLAGDDAKNLGGQLATGLEPGKPPLATRRAAQTTDVMHPALKTLDADRAKDPVLQAKEPRAAAVLLRATIANNKTVASSIGCDILKAPNKVNDVLREAAALACSDLGVVAAALAKNACVPFVRCRDGKPLDGATSTKQDEPLCTELAPLVAAELSKPPQVALSENNPRPELFELATLAAQGHVPDAITLAHARRQYTLTQLDKPSCEAASAGAPCHCDEATIRSNACTQPQSATVDVGPCRFKVDDDKKTINTVVSLGH